MNKIYATLLYLLTLFGCGSENMKIKKDSLNKRVASKEFLTDVLRNRYDSVFAYQDVDWISYKGIGEGNTTTASLFYPFTIFGFKNNNIDLYVYYSEKKIIKRCITSLYNKFDFSFCSYYSKDSRDTVFDCEYFLPNKGKLTFLLRKNDFLDRQFNFGSFSIWRQGENSELSTVYFSNDYIGEKYSMDSCINFIKKGSYPSDYGVMQTSRYKIVGEQFIKVYDKRVDKNFPEENWEKLKEELQYENIVAPSFFYHYTHIFSYCECATK